MESQVPDQVHPQSITSRLFDLNMQSASPWPRLNHMPSPSPSVASTMTPSDLPRPREHPLRPGSQKEIAFINFVDGKMLNISRRYAKKFSSNPADKEGSGKGYDNLKEVVQDLEAVFDVVWVSGTPSLQLPYLLSLASTLVSYIPAFPFATKPTIRMVRKLDSAFTYLLQLDDSNNVARLHSDNVGHHEIQRKVVNRTDRVRIRSVCELTRVCIMEQSQGSIQEVDDEDFDFSDEDTRSPAADEDYGLPKNRGDSDGEARGIAGVYESSLSMLGASLDSDAPQAQDIDLDLLGSSKMDPMDD